MKESCEFCYVKGDQPPTSTPRGYRWQLVPDDISGADPAAVSGCESCVSGSKSAGADQSQFRPDDVSNMASKNGAKSGGPEKTNSHQCNCHAMPHNSDSQSGPEASAYRYGQLMDICQDFMLGKPDPVKIGSFLTAGGDNFWKGAAVGAALTFVVSSGALKSVFSGGLASILGEGEGR